MTITSDEIVVYVGPSLAVEEARQVLDADYRPPIRRGDIDALLAAPSRPRIVGILDGKFFQSFAISPKEILPAIDAGIVMLGASSMGALRATELHPFGMIGVGKIFEMFKDGQLEADDEVAMVFNEEDGRAHSVPMVNIRIALEGAVAKSIITPSEMALLIETIRKVYFPERTYAALLKLVGSGISDATRNALREYLFGDAPDAKRDDGFHLLREIKRRSTLM